MSRGEYLTEKQWEKIGPLLPTMSSRGRPWRRNREVLEGILWVLRTGARWKDLPERYPSPSTCWRRLKLWQEKGVWLDVWRAFLAELNNRGRVDWSECFIDGTFAPAKKGAPASGRPSAARAQSLWWWQTARVFLWEFPYTLPVRRRSRSSGKRSKR